MQHQRIVLALGALAVASALGGCQLPGDDSAQPAGQVDSARSEATVVSDASQEGGSQGDERADSLVIETEYGDLYYPEQWSEYVTTSQEMTEGSLGVVFSARIGETECPMFKVTIGDSADTEVGTLTDESGTARTVHMSVCELGETPGLSAEEQQRVVAMQEDLNYVIDHLA